MIDNMGRQAAVYGTTAEVDEVTGRLFTEEVRRVPKRQKEHQKDNTKFEEALDGQRKALQTQEEKDMEEARRRSMATSTEEAAREAAARAPKEKGEGSN